MLSTPNGWNPVALLTITTWSTSAVSATVISSSMKEADGKTTLELALKADSYVKNGQDALQIILATSRQDSFFALHSYRGWTTVKLAP